MERKKTRTREEKYQYDQQYLKENMKVINITFNRRNDEDMELLDWLAKKPGPTVPYIKSLIRADMERAGE